jgi:hypothetical protein
MLTPKIFLRPALSLLTPTFLAMACTRAVYLGDNGDVMDPTDNRGAEKSASSPYGGSVGL